jgi:cbb3-type cytochrome oxidase cytochrome c subunit
MKYGPLVFLAAFLALSASWCGFVLTPEIQLGRAVQETNSVVKADLYPEERPGLARQGLGVYRANGCVYCHSQQLQQNGTLVNVVLTDVGKNPTAVADALNEAHIENVSGPGLAAGLPKPVLRNATIEAATVLASVLKKAGANSELHLVPTGPDIERGWGARRSVAEDFVFDATVMPGSQRVGPDLADVGARLPDMNWHLMHLFAPRSVTKDSPMPPYPFLFERKKIGTQPSPDALALPKEFAPPTGYEIVPKPEAKALVAYLLSLRAETPLYEAPLTPPPPPAAATNAPAK